MEKSKYSHESRHHIEWPFENSTGEKIAAIPLYGFRQLIFDNNMNYVLFDSIHEKVIVQGKFDENPEDFESYSFFSDKYIEYKKNCILYISLKYNKIRQWDYMLGQEQEDSFGQIFFKDYTEIDNNLGYSTYINAVFEASRIIRSKNNNVYLLSGRKNPTHNDCISPQIRLLSVSDKDEIEMYNVWQKDTNLFELNTRVTPFGERSVALQNPDNKTVWVLSVEDGLTMANIITSFSIIFQNITCCRGKTQLTFNYNESGKAGCMLMDSFKEPSATEDELDKELDERTRNIDINANNFRIVNFNTNDPFYVDQNLIIAEQMNRMLLSTSMPSKNEFKVIEFDENFTCQKKIASVPCMKFGRIVQDIESGMLIEYNKQIFTGMVILRVFWINADKKAFQFYLLRQLMKDTYTVGTYHEIIQKIMDD